MSSFSYNLNIPVGNLSPAAQRSSLVTNTNSAAQIWETDHVGFNANNGGTHAQITFSDVASPSPPSNPISYLFTQLISGVPQLAFLNSGGTYPLTNIPLVNSGTQYGLRTPWGLIFNFGNLAATTSGAQIMFQVPFANLIAVTTGIFGGTPGNLSVSISDLHNDRATFKTTVNAPVYYIAVGT